MHAIYSVICTMQVYLTMSHPTVIHEKCLDLSNLDAKFKIVLDFYSKIHHFVQVWCSPKQKYRFDVTMIRDNWSS